MKSWKNGSLAYKLKPYKIRFGPYFQQSTLGKEKRMRGNNSSGEAIVPKYVSNDKLLSPAINLISRTVAKFDLGAGKSVQLERSGCLEFVTAGCKNDQRDVRDLCLFQHA